MTDSPNYVRICCERSNAKRVATSIQRALVACDNAMQDDMLDALYHARDEGGAATKVNYPSISILSVFSRHRRTSRRMGVNPTTVPFETLRIRLLSGTYLYTRWSNAGDQSRTALMSYYLSPGLLKVNPEIPSKPVFFAQPLLWRPYLRAGLSVQARSDSVCKLTTTLSSAIWGGITPFFLLSRTPAQSNLTSFGSPPTLGLDPPTT